MERDRDNFLQRLDEGQKIYRSIGDAAPAWGMIGTLLGMVQMFANMSDPSKLGPFMAVSLLATLYGALVGNLICLPIADKLHLKLEEEDISRCAHHRRHPADPRRQEPDDRARDAARLPARPSPPRNGRSGLIGTAGEHGAQEGRRHDGGHGWFVTFADLMALLMSFFVMLTAMSTQDQKKLQIVAGSMRDAFGTQRESRLSGIIESDGIPVRPNLKNIRQAPPEQGSDFTAPSQFSRPDDGVAVTSFDRAFALAAVSLRQACRTCPRSRKYRRTSSSRKPRTG